MRYFVTIDGVEHAVEVNELPGGGYDVRLFDDVSGTMSDSGRSVEATVIRDVGPLTLQLDGRVFDLVIDGDPPQLEVFASGRRAAVRVESARMRAAASVRSKAGGAAGGILSSPMPGKVIKVLVNEGDAVAPGTPLVVVEAMKMENELVAETAGNVQQIFVQPGDAVEGGARLVSIA